MNSPTPKKDLTHEAARAYIAREQSGTALTGEQAVALRSHVRDCADCRRVYERYVSAERLLSEAEPPALSPAQLARVEDRLFSAGPPPARRGGLVLGGFAAAAALAGVLLMPRSETLQARGAATVDALPGASVRVLRVDRFASGELALRELAATDPVAEDTKVVVLAACPVEDCRVAVSVVTADGRERRFIDADRLSSTSAPVRLDEPASFPAAWPAGRAEVRAAFRTQDGRQTVRTLPLVLER